MRQKVIVDINDNRKTHIILNLMRELEFVDKVQTREFDMSKVKAKQKNETKKLNLATGIWKDNDITAEQLRKKAWQVKK